VRSWLYSIVTNAALDLARRRTRRELPAGVGPAADPGGELGDPVRDPVWLEPFPDRLLAGTAARSPEARYEQRESVELAFVIALQGLPPLPRAVFILREVLGFSATEISGQLGMSAASVTSALQRARRRMRSRLPATSQQAAMRGLGDERLRAIAVRYADALEQGDADTLISMLTADATWSMPPLPAWFSGHQGIREFLVRWPLAARWKHAPARSNGQLAMACYLWDPDTSSYVPAVIDVLTITGEQISAVTAFMTPDALGRRAEGSQLSGTELFALFGLPARPEPG
jgi:RNA polymerase sigma-70 factor (ECF subfamily)